MRLVSSILILSLMLAYGCASKPFAEAKKTTIGIQPLGSFSVQFIDSVQSALKAAYQCNIAVLPTLELPEAAFINVKSPRYRADSLLRFLNRHRPDSISYVLGLTASDISCTKRDDAGNVLEPAWKYEDWGVFGLGYMPGTACVVSTFRLKHSNRSTTIERLQKVAVHEIGHNCGLDHCPNEGCVMQDAVERIGTIDNESGEMCSACFDSVH